jgi:hypothetical protein
MSPLYECECPEGHKNEYYDPLPNVRSQPCPVCGKPTERLYSLYSPRVFQTFVSRNILEDGTPVTVRGPGQLAQLQTDHGVRLADRDARPPHTETPSVADIPGVEVKRGP